MPFETNDPASQRVSSLLGSTTRLRVTDRGRESYERELAALRGELRRVVARDAVLLAEKDEAIRHQTVLTAECQHRMLNNLQMIVALLLLQSRSEGDAPAAASLAIAAGRVQAIAGLHQHLHSMDGKPTVEFKKYLGELCRDHSTMSMSAEQPDRSIAVEAIELSLPTAVGIPLSLIVNELVTNAIKHGTGRITVTLAPSAKGHALSVHNEGSSLPAGFDPTVVKGLGMTLISSLAAQIGGELRVDRGDGNDGARFTLLFNHLPPERSYPAPAAPLGTAGVTLPRPGGPEGELSARLPSAA